MVVILDKEVKLVKVVKVVEENGNGDPYFIQVQVEEVVVQR